MPPPEGVASTSRADFYKVLTDAINDMLEHGFDSMDRITLWVERIREAAIRSLVPQRVLETTLVSTFRGIYRQTVERGMILRQHPGVSLFTLERVKPALRAELDRRILASADLIKLNREAAVRDTLQRFSGWATSIPAGGSDAVNRREQKAEIRKPLASLPFRERRVAIDQGHKFSNNLSEILAVEGGALAGIWHSHWRQINYRFRPDHKERDERLYVVRDNWALERGLMKLGGHEYTDQITKPGEEVYCRCFYQYLYSLRRLPADMLTEKGRAELERVKIAA